MSHTVDPIDPHTSHSDDAPAPKTSHSWRVIDIVVASVLAAACGLIFFVWNTIGYAGYNVLDAFTPGLGGLCTGIWFLGGTLGAVIIRKPGAAIFVEFIAATVSALLGNVWGITTLYSGLAQGLGVEVVFLATRYRSYKLPTCVIGGVGAAVGAFILELFLTPNIAKSFAYNAIYLSTMAVSGAVLAGLLAWWLTKALRATGVLSRFASGRED